MRLRDPANKVRFEHWRLSGRGSGGCTVYPKFLFCLFVVCNYCVHILAWTRVQNRKSVAVHAQRQLPMSWRSWMKRAGSANELSKYDKYWERERRYAAHCWVQMSVWQQTPPVFSLSSCVTILFSFFPNLTVHVTQWYFTSEKNYYVIYYSVMTR